jgi:hypothetical protein
MFCIKTEPLERHFYFLKNDLAGKGLVCDSGKSAAQIVSNVIRSLREQLKSYYKLVKLCHSINKSRAFLYSGQYSFRGMPD